ncbi:MAG: ComF family protein [bacterium]|nr:ComF family protein [bacterium]
MFRQLLLELVDAVYPPACFLCGAPAADWACDAHRIPARLLGPRCGRCVAPLPAALPDGYACARCRRRPPGFERVLALADYGRESAAREWLLAFKHGGRRDLARPLGAALARRCLEVGVEADLLVPVPLHPWRRLARGYDQARALAQRLAEDLDVRVEPALARTRATLEQGAPSSPSRAANVRSAFACDPAARRHLRGRAVWLVDDVLTSGATASECAHVLKRAGAQAVGVLCVARATRRRALPDGPQSTTLTP